MAFYDQNEEEQVDPNAAPAAAQTGPSSAVINGQGAGGEGGAQPAETASSKAGNNFVGISQYLEANKPQSAKLAQDVGGYVSNLGQEAQTQLNQGQQQFNQAVDQNTVNLNQEVFDRAKTNAEQVAADQGQAAEFKKMRDAQYNGPAAFEASEFYQPAQQAVSKAVTAAEQTTNEQGQRDLLTAFQKKDTGTFKKGANTLDAALLLADPTARTTLESARSFQPTLTANLEKAKQEGLAKAQEAAKQTGITKDTIFNAFTGENGVQKNLEKELVSRADGLRKQSKEQQDATIAAIKKNISLNPQQLQLLGVTEEEYKQLNNNKNYYDNVYGMEQGYGSLYSKDPRNMQTFKDTFQGTDTSFDPYIKLTGTPESQITAQNAATAEEYARYAALNELMDGQEKFLFDPSQAGTANLDTVDFDLQGAAGHINANLDRAKNFDVYSIIQYLANLEAQSQGKDLTQAGANIWNNYYKN